MRGITIKPHYTVNDHGFFGLVQIIIGTRIVSDRIIRICRKDRAAALDDAGKLARAMLALGVNTPINLNDYK